MYNLTVDEAHTFFVGDGQWLVHNCAAGLGGILKGATGGPYEITKPNLLGDIDQTLKYPYYDEVSRGQFELFVNQDGKLVNSRGELLDQGTFRFPDFTTVMSPDGHIYLARTASIENLHHSSFLAGGDVAYAGEVTIKSGILYELNYLSGHYHTNLDMLYQFLAELRARGADTSHAIPP